MDKEAETKLLFSKLDTLNPLLARMRRAMDLKLEKDGEEAEDRNKKNAVTFFAQFCSFITELVFMVVAVYALRFGRSNNFVYYGLTILKKFCLCIMAVIEVVASSTLRSRVLN